MINRCVCCGEEIPEGRTVCWRCEHGTSDTNTLNEQKGENTMTKTDWARKLTSRKLWAAVAEFVAALLIFLKKDKSLAQEVASLIMLGVAPIAYMFAEGWADAGNAGNLTRNVRPDDEEHPPEQ